jgi:hypothetical protein
MLFTTDKVGADFKLTKDYDLLVSPSGAIEYTTGAQTIANALVRRVSTALGQYSKYVRLGRQIYLLNSTYGSQLSFYLSSPNSNDIRIKETIDQAARMDNRVSIENVRLVSSQTPGNTVNVEVIYRILPQYLNIPSGANATQQLLIPMT